MRCLSGRPVEAAGLFELELIRRGLPFQLRHDLDAYELDVEGHRLRVQLDNSTRTVSVAVDA